MCKCTPNIRTPFCGKADCQPVKSAGSKEKLLKLLDDEIEFAKGCGMPQFVMGIIQARKVVADFKEEALPND